MSFLVARCLLNVGMTYECRRTRHWGLRRCGAVPSGFRHRGVRVGVVKQRSERHRRRGASERTRKRTKRRGSSSREARMFFCSSHTLRRDSPCDKAKSHVILLTFHIASTSRAPKVDGTSVHSSVNGLQRSFWPHSPRRVRDQGFVPPKVSDQAVESLSDMRIGDRVPRT